MTNVDELQSYEILTVRREGRVEVVTLNRPERMNALTPELHARLEDALHEAAADNGVGAVVLTGAGRAFCAGGDLRQGDSPRGSTPPRPVTMEDRADDLAHHAKTTRLLHTMPKPTIAMMNGAAAGAGLALALACDLRIAADDAVLTTAYARVAMSGDLGINWFLTRLVGAGRARELMLLSDKLDAQRAESIGLVTRAVARSELYDTTMEIATRLAMGPAVAQRYIKQNLNDALASALGDVLEAEAMRMARCGRTPEVKEAALAFREKRTARFHETS
jgi:2-(1,2-epoxy-1,2-dihydrophenyl)acetyl-CoA isomerase